jgi:hypothetical protein
MSALSLDYGALLASLDQPPQPEDVGAILANAAADRYQVEHEGACALFEFEQIGATYWFDFASSAALPQEDRTVAAWAVTPTNVRRRDSSYQRGFPMAPVDGSPVDRGHLIPHLSGGVDRTSSGRIQRSTGGGRNKVSVIGRSSVQQRECLGRCTSGTCYTPTKPPTPNRSRSPSCFQVQPCALRSSTTVLTSNQEARRFEAVFRHLVAPSLK